MTKYLLILILCSISHSFSSEEKKEDTSIPTSISLPTLKGMTIENFAIALAGYIEINGREWSIAKEADQNILRQFLTQPHISTTELKLFEEGFSSIPYDVDVLGHLRMSVSFTNENFIDEEGFYIPYQTFLVTQLTAEELSLPEVMYKQLSVSFEQHSEDYKDSKYKTRYIENCNKMAYSMISLIIDESQRNLASQEHEQLMQQMAELPRACDIESYLSR